MKIAVAGLWHLGTVTAACCASLGHDVTAFDDDRETVGQLVNGSLPVAEPGLAELIKAGVRNGRLRFTTDAQKLVDADILWICYDTPVDERDRADVDFVLSRIRNLCKELPPKALILISSQLPVGSIARLERWRPDLCYACSPENLRLGSAIEAFLKPARIVAGYRADSDKRKLTNLFSSFTTHIEWMSIESAEMTKHALNAFLATSIVFINEVARLCETAGADAREVQRGLMSDERIGPKSYLHAGSAFAGGTLARDLLFLADAGAVHGIWTDLLTAVITSNGKHLRWPLDRLSEVLNPAGKATVAVLGLTYKPKTNTLRRSSSVQTCLWLIERGVTVNAFDPAIQELPSHLATIHLAESAEAALTNADAAFIGTAWPEFQTLPDTTFREHMKCARVIDPGRYLEHSLRRAPGIEYIGIGLPQ